MSTKKRVIGIDFDDVLMDFHRALHPYCNPKYNANLKREDLNHYRLHEFWGCTPSESESRVVDFYHSDAHDNATPTQGSVEAVKKICAENKCVVITSRPDFVREKTVNWLSRHFGDIFDLVYFTNIFASRGGTKKTKAEVCMELGVEIFIDDHFDYAKDIADSGKKALLLDAPWNQGEGEHPNITRVHSWDHILEVLK